VRQRLSSAGHEAPAGTGTPSSPAPWPAPAAAKGVSPPTSRPARSQSDPCGTGPGRQFGQQAGLSYPRLTGQDQDLPLAGGGGLPCRGDAGSSAPRRNKRVRGGTAAGACSCDWAARVAGEGRTPSSSRSKLGETAGWREPLRPGRHPPAAGRSKSRCAPRPAAPAHTAGGTSPTASAVLPSRSACAACSSSFLRQAAPVLRTGGNGPVVVHPGQQLAVPRPAGSSGAWPARASTHIRLPRSPIELRDPSSTSSAAGPQPAAPTRSPCAGWPGHSRQVRPARPRGQMGRECDPGCSASQPIRARTRSEAGTAAARRRIRQRNLPHSHSRSIWPA